MGAHLNVCDLIGLHLVLKGVTPICQFYCAMGYIVDEKPCLIVLLRYATCDLLRFCCSKKKNRNWHSNPICIAEVPVRLPTLTLVPVFGVTQYQRFKL